MNRNELENMALKTMRDVLKAYLAENPNGKYISMTAVLSEDESGRWYFAVNNKYWDEDQNYPVGAYVFIDKDKLDGGDIYNTRQSV